MPEYSPRQAFYFSPMAYFGAVLGLSKFNSTGLKRFGMAMMVAG